MVKPDLGTLFHCTAKSGKVPKSGKDISYEATPNHLMLAKWQLHTVSLETCMSGQGLVETGQKITKNHPFFSKVSL